LPCVATRPGGFSEVIQDQVTGLLVDPEKPEQLVAALKQLVVDPELRHRMGEAGKRRATALFDRRSFVEQFAGLLEK
jgi:glycosyltransferase involved in cell wall biosynthesis